MSQRLIAALVAVPLVLALVLAAALMPLPFVVYSPGYTVDVLAEDENEAEIIQVDGREAYYDGGELRMTTVLVTAPETEKNLFELMAAWIDPDDAVYPDLEEGKTDEENRIEGQVQMISSQDAAKAAALRELGEEVPTAPGVALVEEGSPAEGKLLVHDLFLEVDGERVATPQDVVSAVAASEGEQVEFVVLRDRRRQTVRVRPEQTDDGPRVGVRVGTGYRFPFDVTINISPDIGGPSAGSMFALAIYDTLTPGSLVGDRSVAGTGEITGEGEIGAIGGVQQKIVAGRDAGADLFLVPPDNCDEAEGADPGEMLLIAPATLREARTAIEAWVEDPEADLPTCEDVLEATS